MTPAAAYRAVRTALQSGRLIRPASCQRCGAPNLPCSDGRSRIHAHHHDYSKPLDVEWICTACHRHETPLPKTMGTSIPGERNGQSKMTDAIVINARVLRAEGWTYSAIARLYGVDKRAAMRAVKGESWKHIPLSASPSFNPVVQEKMDG